MPKVKARSRRAPTRGSGRRTVRGGSAAARRARLPGATALPPIDCVLVLMLENRSFDHLFGKWPGAAGLSEPPWSNRVNPLAPAAPGSNPTIAAGQPALFTVT
jgi:phospholipase C